MYLLNVYSVFKVHEGVYFVPHLVGNENGQKLTPIQKFFEFCDFFADRGGGDAANFCNLPL